VNAEVSRSVDDADGWLHPDDLSLVNIAKHALPHMHAQVLNLAENSRSYLASFPNSAPTTTTRHDTYTTTPRHDT
jgi:hypothetical protein